MNNQYNTEFFANGEWQAAAYLTETQIHSVVELIKTLSDMNGSPS